MVNAAGATITQRGANNPADVSFLPFVSEPDTAYRVLLYKADKASAEATFSNVSVQCFEPHDNRDLGEEHPALRLLELEAFAEERLQSARGPLDSSRAQLHDHFSVAAGNIKAIAAQSGVDASQAITSAREWLRPEFDRISARLKAAYPQVREDLLWPFYLANVAHYSVALTRQDAPTAHGILVDGGGTCWQQAQVAVEIFNTEPGAQRAKVSSSDSLALGHAFFAGPGFIADITNNFFLQIEPIEWSRMNAPERMAFLENRAVYGVSLDVIGHKGRDESLEIFPQEQLDEGYVDTIRRLPYARISL